MDCSLSTWPSITQFDDLTWMGLGDIDPLESLDRSLDSHSQFTESSFTIPEETNPASPATKVAFNNASVEIPHSKSDDFYRLTSCESLAAARWESINAVDLASVLDSFPSSNETSTPGEEDVYDLYSESIMQAESQLAGDVDAFMSDAMSELPEANSVALCSEETSPRNNAAVMSSDHTSVSCTQEDAKCETSTVDDESPPSVNIAGSVCSSVSRLSTENCLLPRVDCSAQHMEYVDSSGCGSRINVMQPAGCYTFCPAKLPDHVDPSPSSQGALNLRQSITQPQHEAIQPSMMIQWSKPHSMLANAQLFNREQVVQQSPMRSYPAIIDQHLRMADAARVTSELKRNRAQASRARRLAASQRRAKKYPLQKLIRMSSSPASTRDKVDQNTSTTAAMLHWPLQPASPNQQPAATSNSQLLTFLPVPQGSQLASSHELLTHANAVQCAPYYHRRLPSAPCQDNLVSPSGSSTLQDKHDDQHVQSLGTLPSLAGSHILNPNESLDEVVLHQMQNIVSKMNVDTRFCIRDALYRLARSSKIRQSKCENVPGSVGANSSHSEAIETNTNSMDRWIVNMLFCKQSAPFDGNSQPFFPQGVNHTSETNNTNTFMQQWNSCGSFLNLQDQPLHVVTGL